MKKTWTDDLLDVANAPQTKAQKKLRGILRTLVFFKNHLVTTDEGLAVGYLPSKIVRELEAVNRRLRFEWKPRVLFTGIRRSTGKEGEGMDFRPWTKGLRLRIYLPISFETEMDGYYLDLINRLKNARWVGALRECPGCGKLILSEAKWQKKYCSRRCLKASQQRKLRKRIECPAENWIRTELDCRQAQKGKYYNQCRNCPNRKEE